MHRFNYTYQGLSLTSVALVYMEDGLCRYRVTLGASIWLTITAVEIPGTKEAAYWTQVQRHGEIPQPDELVQALGKGLHDAGITGLNS
jgi:hypothetical protein